jgi:hypothetical protein
MPTTKLTVFAVSHDQNLLDELPKTEFIKPILLDNLDLRDEHKGNELAENRLLLTDLLVNSQSGQVGFVSARWNERFPTWPQIECLDQLIYRGEETDRYYFAPQTLLASGAQVESWIKAQDAVHPGMSKLLFEVIDKLSASNFDDSSLRGISMGNNFIVSGKTASELLDFWQTGFNYLFDKYGFDLPFEYRCASCGLVSDEGVGRWSRSRHAGYLFERLTALFFATNPSLIPIEPHNGEHRKVRRGLISFGFTSGPFLFRILKTILRFGKPCDHPHEALGKKKK